MVPIMPLAYRKPSFDDHARPDLEGAATKGLYAWKLEWPAVAHLKIPPELVSTLKAPDALIFASFIHWATNHLVHLVRPPQVISQREVKSNLRLKSGSD